MKAARTVFTSFSLVITFVVFIISFSMQEYYYVSIYYNTIQRITNPYGPAFRWISMIMVILLVLQLVLGCFRNKGVFLASLIIGFFTLTGAFALLGLAFASIPALRYYVTSSIVAAIFCSIMMPFIILSFAFSIPVFVRLCRPRVVVRPRPVVKQEEPDELPAIVKKEHDESEEDLKKLSELRDSGAITNEEFERIKNKIVSK